jgi:hypothetical protein
MAAKGETVLPTALIDPDRRLAPTPQLLMTKQAADCVPLLRNGAVNAADLTRIVGTRAFWFGGGQIGIFWPRAAML